MSADEHDLRMRLIAIAQAFEAAECPTVGLRLRGLPSSAAPGAPVVWLDRLREATAIAVSASGRARGLAACAWRAVVVALDEHAVPIGRALGLDDECVLGASTVAL